MYRNKETGEWCRIQKETVLHLGGELTEPCVLIEIQDQPTPEFWDLASFHHLWEGPIDTFTATETETVKQPVRPRGYLAETTLFDYVQEIAETAKALTAKWGNTIGTKAGFLQKQSTGFRFDTNPTPTTGAVYIAWNGREWSCESLEWAALADLVLTSLYEYLESPAVRDQVFLGAKRMKKIRDELTI